MMLWVLVLSFWMMAVCVFSQSLPLAMRARVLVVLGLVSVGFILFLLMTSNPFLRQFTVLDSQGKDLNPLLQDPGFLFHPPMLYMGYVGFSVAFAFAIAALWAGKVEPVWCKWTRPWTLAAWCCLTAGITLGSWWAYRELGWGGWWFWDPVENASFMPWLTGTALIHSLMVTEKRELFKAWTMLLAITAFSLSLIGTFLVRSGVLTSVHAFAVDPQRGYYILTFLLVVIGGSLLLFSLRAQTLSADQQPHPVSKEGALLLNNVFLIVIMLTVLLGTVYPLMIDGLGLGKLSVGAPYFNAVFVPLMLPVLLLMGLGIHLSWYKASLKALPFALLAVCLVCVGLAITLFFMMKSGKSLQLVLALALALWVISTTLLSVYFRFKNNLSFRGMSQAYWGMVIAHLGVAVCVLGIAVSQGFGIQKDVRMQPGSVEKLGGYTVKFIQEQRLMGSNYHGAEAEFLVQSSSHSQRIYPQKRIYNVGQMAMTESDIDVNPFRDIYVALGEPLNENAWSVRLYYKPLIRWIWGGGFLILLGGLLALTDRRYYANAQVRKLELSEQS